MVLKIDNSEIKVSADWRSSIFGFTDGALSRYPLMVEGTKKPIEVYSEVTMMFGLDGQLDGSQRCLYLEKGISARICKCFQRGLTSVMELKWTDPPCVWSAPCSRIEACRRRDLCCRCLEAPLLPATCDHQMPQALTADWIALTPQGLPGLQCWSGSSKAPGFWDWTATELSVSVAFRTVKAQLPSSNCVSESNKSHCFCSVLLYSVSSSIISD